ncbi:kinase-like protein [Trichocladium antarcticum]|uniref:Kinase-like protein n=1 Tax=Trichocladium antarcticum TaxID=1450529 RepID=A0AAN6ZB69_9PEZI|nr:kinase-like protein [Trichocladium antarcticum]
MGRASSESSDDEMPVPMKLSALTKALLHDDSPAVREKSPLNADTPKLALRTVKIPVGSSGSSGHPAPGAPQSSMRIKRIGNAPGSFLSGPARRGRRRQSEEDGEGQPQSQERGAGEDLASSILQATSGSPVSGRDSARAALRRHMLSKRSPPEQKEPEHNLPPPRTTPRNILSPIVNNVPQRAAPPPPPKMSVVETATAAAGASTATQANKKKQFLLRVNGRTYTRIDCVGRGGSGKVYRVAAESGKMLALKRVSLDKADATIIRGYKGEIDLLERLTGVDRVIQLIDHELNVEKNMLSLLMEIGELDFDSFLKSRQNTAEGGQLDSVFVRHYWKEMLECVRAVHAQDIVHSDLKPANFVLVRGRLKLIDFGIANAIQTDMTVNVHREGQVGTPNYMSPESLMDSKQYAFNSARNGEHPVAPPTPSAKGVPKVTKLGKPSDVWSLGCILHQLVYGHPPFSTFPSQLARCYAIINWDHTIDFPPATQDGVRVPPSLVRTMRRCLDRDQTMRPTCDELLAPTDPFLYPVELHPSVLAAAEQGSAIPITEAMLSRVVQSVVQQCRKEMPGEHEVQVLWSQAYWSGLKRTLAHDLGGGGGGGGGRGMHNRDE